MKNKNYLLSEQYFKAWNSRSLISFNELFCSDVLLEDWEVKIKGKSDMLLHIERVFDTFPDMEVKVLSMKNLESKIIAEIDVKLDLNTTIQVIDVLHFVNFKIKSIKAYKRLGNTMHNNKI